VRLGLVADAHCNWRAVEIALNRLRGRVDRLLFAGDAVYEYRFSNEVVELLRDHEVSSVLGNHEVGILAPEGVRARSAPGVRADNIDFLRALPSQVELDLQGSRLLMVHGSPWNPHREYVYPGTPGLQRFAALDYDFVVLGHTHVPMAERVGRVLVANPGSIGESRTAGGGDVTYAILDTVSAQVTFESFPDPRRN
jgi:putative phosphoesterase